MKWIIILLPLAACSCSEKKVEDAQSDSRVSIFENGIHATTATTDHSNVERWTLFDSEGKVLTEAILENGRFINWMPTLSGFKDRWSAPATEYFRKIDLEQKVPFSIWILSDQIYSLAPRNEDIDSSEYPTQEHIFSSFDRIFKTLGKNNPVVIFVDSPVRKDTVEDLVRKLSEHTNEILFHEMQSDLLPVLISHIVLDNFRSYNQAEVSIPFAPASLTL